MDIEIYTKVCLSCTLGEDWTKLQVKLIHAGYHLHTHRTTYDPSLHKKATKLWGDATYLAFAAFPDGKVIALGALEDMIDDIKDKRVKAGKTKPVRKKRSKKNDMLGLSETPRSIRVDYMESKTRKIKVENKTRQEVQEMKDLEEAARRTCEEDS